MTFLSTEQQRRAPAPEPAPAFLPPRRRRTGAFVAAALGVAWVLGAACTLTSDGFEPPLVDTDPLATPPAPAPDASACEGGAECCTAIACPTGESCVEGSCRSVKVVDPAEPVDAGPPPCVGTDCPGEMPPVPLAPSCDDGVQNGDETGSDCGGGCSARCGVGDGCVSDADCSEGFVCSPQALLCAEVSCTDGERNGTETATDCGGTCPACPDGQACGTGADCQSRVCDDDICAEPSCNDDQQNGDETGPDCGGTCPQNCGTGDGCARNNDCQSGVCGTLGCDDGVARCCQAPSCNDDVLNGGESDVDCGTAACGLCSLGDSCVVSIQCNTGLCQGGVCVIAPRCDDNIENGTESDVDCGGICGVCPDLSDCNADTDCVNNNCDPSGICISCGDNVRNGTETGVDCGGADPFCRRCNPGEVCASNTDCVSQFCFGGFCG